jgi:hypothetical protein
MKILSIDPAIKSLAISKMDINDGVITNLEMHMINLCGKKKISCYSFSQIVDLLFEELDKIDITGVQCIIIENIPSYKNALIKSISVCVYSYYVLKGENVVFVSPNSKPKEIKECKTYTERKKKSVELCTKILKDNDLIAFNVYKKKDDIADSIMQAIFYENKK